MSYKGYTDEDIIKNCRIVFSMRQLLQSLNLQPAGGNYIQAKRNLQRLRIDTSHWKKQGWNKDLQLKKYSEYTRIASLKRHLLKMQSFCDCCEIEEWNQLPIVLEVHHKDGDRTNNNRENLALLCPNCHSQTKGWRGKS